MSEAAALMPDRSDSPASSGMPEQQVLMHDHPVLGTYRLPRDSGASWKRYALEMCVVNAAVPTPLSILACICVITLAFRFLPLHGVLMNIWHRPSSHTSGRRLYQTREVSVKCVPCVCHNM